MCRIYTELDAFSQWPSRDRIRALRTLLPRKLLNQAIQTGVHAGRFCRRLPPWFMIWFVVGLGLFCCDSYRQIFKWLNPGRGSKTPGRSTLCMARLRIGIAPLRWLLDHALGLLGKTRTPGVFYRDFRLMGLDGFVLDVPDTSENDRIFGRPYSRRGVSAFPQVRVLSLCELGTHLLWRNLIKPLCRGEVSMAPALLRFLQPDMLLLWDRGFFSYSLLRQVAVTQKAQLLARLKSNLIFQSIRALSDGSYLAKAYPSRQDRAEDRNGILVRIIEYTLTDPKRTGCGEKHRLLTTLLDETQDPALELVDLYHQRWEEELTIDELKTHQRERPVLRSQTAAGVVQEVYGLLVAHGLVRTVMTAAAEKAGVAPRRISFTGTLKILRCRLPECPSSQAGRKRWYEALMEEIAEEILPERQQRINPRVIKKKISKWPKKQPQHRSPLQPKKRFRDTVKILD